MSAMSKGILLLLGSLSHDPSGGLSESFFADVFLPRLFGSFFVHFTRRFHCASPGLVIFGWFCHVHLIPQGQPFGV
jgi:hypothetical protein